MRDALGLQRRSLSRHGHLSRFHIEQAQAIFDVHRDEAFVDEQRQVRVRGRALHVTEPVVLLVFEHHRDLSGIDLDRIDGVVPLHVLIRLHPVDPSQMGVYHLGLGLDQRGMLISQPIAIGEKQFALIRGEAKTRGLS